MSGEQVADDLSPVVTDKQYICITDAGTTLVQSLNLCFTTCHTVVSDTHVANSTGAPSCDIHVASDHWS